MKKVLVNLQIVLLLAITLPAFAQPLRTPAEAVKDIARALKGGRVSLESNKSLMEPNDGAALSVKLTIYPQFNEQTGENEGVPYYMDLPDGSDPNSPAQYKEGNWKIVQGGGALTRIDETHYTYMSPATAPPDNIMVISVDLNPTGPNWPKLVLLKTLYFVNDQTAIVVNLPEVGFNNQKYVTQTGGGVKIPSMEGLDTRVASHIDPALQAKMDAAKAAMEAAQRANGIDLTALTSNAMAYYDPKNDLTAIKFTQLSLQMENGRDVRSSATANPNTILCEFSYKGKGTGQHALSDKISGVGFLIVGTLKGCGCGNNRNGQEDQAPCNGYVNIKSMDDKVMKGELWAEVYSVVDKRIVRGFIHGRFTANIAKFQ